MSLKNKRKKKKLFYFVFFTPDRDYKLFLILSSWKIISQKAKYLQVIYLSETYIILQHNLKASVKWPDPNYLTQISAQESPLCLDYSKKPPY